jgi:hypothetical protein
VVYHLLRFFLLKPKSVMMSVASVLLIVMSCCVLAIFSFPNGAPLQACEDLVPRHPLSPQNSVAPYKLVVQALVKDDKNVGREFCPANGQMALIFDFVSLLS